MSQQTALPGAPTTQTTRLLACGIVAGPLFLAVGLIQAFTREGFDLRRHSHSPYEIGSAWGTVCTSLWLAKWTALWSPPTIGLPSRMRPARYAPLRINPAAATTSRADQRVMRAQRAKPARVSVARRSCSASRCTVSWTLE